MSGASLLAAFLSLSLVSDWLRRHAIDTVESHMWPADLYRRWISWGTCWPIGYHFDADYNRPEATFSYVLIRLPSWSWDHTWRSRISDRDEWCWQQRALYKFGPLRWRMIFLEQT